MLNFHDVENLLHRFTYKPNVEIEARLENPWDDQSYRLDPAHPDIMVRAVMWTLDSRLKYPLAREFIAAAAISMHGVNRDICTPDGNTYHFNSVKIATSALIPRMVLEEGEKVFWIWLRSAVIGQLENHEIDEWFQVDGKPYNDPHRNSTGGTTTTYVRY